MRNWPRWPSFLALTVSIGWAFGSATIGGGPRTLDAGSGLDSIDHVDHRRIAPPDLAAVLSGDDAGHGTGERRHRRWRVAVPVGLGALSSDLAGTWESVPGGTVWRLRLSSDGARFLSVKLTDHVLPAGSELHFLSVDRDYVAGPFTERHDRDAQRFGSPIVPGSSMLVELFVPSDVPAPRLTLESASYGIVDSLRAASAPLRAVPLPGAGPPAPAAPVPLMAAGGPFGCQRDINCPEGLPFQDEKRAAAEGYDGAFVCSGQLLNNVRRDNRYLYVTAAHCEWFIDPSTMVYYWNYENSGCGTNDAPVTFSTGSTDLYHDVDADLDLLELDGTDLEEDYDVYFMGWNATPPAPLSGAMISFPDDKPKQIVVDDDPIVDCAVGPCPGGFGAEFWRVDDWEVGVDQVGSSGGGLMDQNRRVVGVLTGGVGTNCNNFAWDEFAQFYPHWSALAPFLDPDASGVLSIPGKNAAGAPPLGDGIDGTAIRLGRGPGNQLQLVFDAATCRAERAAVLWGNLGDWSDYQGDVGTGCSAGNSGNATFEFAGAGVWFNVVWVGSDDAAGPPGNSTAGPRDWTAAGSCGITADDDSTQVCD